MVQVVVKGKEGEREVCRLLNRQLSALVQSGRYDDPTVTMLQNVVQRNQNQSAVGGGDIDLFGLSIEVKRQETLAVETWWRQACASAARNGDKPVLMYRQNRKSWHVVMDGYMPLPHHDFMGARVVVSLESFLQWFAYWVEDKLRAGEVHRV